MPCTSVHTPMHMPAHTFINMPVHLAVHTQVYQHIPWPEVMAYIVMACIVMAYVVMHTGIRTCSVASSLHTSVARSSLTASVHLTEKNNVELENTRRLQVVSIHG